MLTFEDARIAQELKHRLQALTPIHRLVVFGSRARGDATSESDVDVFVEVPSLTPLLRRRISEIAWELSLEHEVVISTLVATHDDIEHGPWGANPILRAIEAEGVAV